MTITEVIRIYSDNKLLEKFKQSDLDIILEWFEENSVLIKEEIQIVTVEKFQEFLDSKKFHRRNFHYPSYEELMKEIEAFKISRLMTRYHCLYLLDKWMIHPKIRHELTLAFKVFDTEKRGYLDLEDIETIVTNKGDIFNTNEVRELLRDADVRGDGNIFYENFIEMIFSQAPQLYDIAVDYLYENADEDPSVPPEVVLEDETEQNAPKNN